MTRVKLFILLALGLNAISIVGLAYSIGGPGSEPLWWSMLFLSSCLFGVLHWRASSPL